MSFEPLTQKAEKVLQEILDHRFENGACNFRYWQKRFSDLPMAEDMQLRSIFKELSDADMISTQWADGTVYFMAVLNNGLSYFEMKEKAEKDEKRARSSNRWHDLFLVFLGAVFGGVVEFLLFKFFGIGA